MEEPSMRAGVVTEPGDPNVLKIRNVPLGPLAAGKARVRVERSSVNAADLWTRHPGIVSEYPHIPGSDGFGVLESVNGACDIDLGEHVVINPALQRHAGTRNWQDPFADIVDILGYNCPGTCAEYCDVPISNVFRAPSHLTPEEAAALPLTYLTAWRMLVTRGKLARGESILIWGASGGLGSAAVIIANYLGAHVLATAGSDHDASLIEQSMRPEAIIRYDKGNVSEQVQKALGRKVDIVFDSVAGPTWASTLESLRPGGRVVLAGTTAGDLVSHDLSDFFYYQWTLLGCRMGDERDFQAMLQAVNDGQIRPIIGTVLPLSELARAHELLEEGNVVGKIVVNNLE